MANLTAAVERLARAREIEAHEKKALAAVQAVIDEKFGKALAKAKLCLIAARNESMEAAGIVRVQAIQSAANLRRHPAVTIKQYETIEYEDADAHKYCRKHFPSVLKLNRRAFEKIAKVADLDFVTFGSEPRATIKRDLSAWLPGGEGDDG